MDSPAPAPTLPGSAYDGVTSCSRCSWWKSGGAGRWSPGHLVNCHLVGCLAKTAVRLLLATLSQLQAEVDGMLEREGLVSCKNREEMPYTFACVLEATRY